MWTPEYTSISELFASLSDCMVADSLLLVVKLWEVYSEKMHPTKSLDQLYGLMETMLNDFQDIDNNLVEPSKLFLNIADLKELTDFSFLEPEQREAIEQFFGKFLADDNGRSPLKSQFKTMWNQLKDIYETYQQTLLSTDDLEPLVYEGMMKRRVIETLTGSDETKRKRTDARLTSQTYVMIGFNVLNKTELELFRYLKQNRQALFYWDYDMSYTNPRRSMSTILNKYEAGQFIEENIRLLGDEFQGKDVFRNMQQPKHITFIQSPTENAQTRYISTWLKEHLKQDEPLNESAIILCNEELLQPVLHSIPPSSPDEQFSVNVTMGYPLTETPAFSLVQTLLDLQVHGHASRNAWKYKYVMATLKHPFIQKLLGQKGLQKMQELTDGKILFPSVEHFAYDEAMRHIFTPLSSKRLTVYLSEVISLVGHSYQDNYNSQDFTLQIQKESIFLAYTLVNRIATLQETSIPLAMSNELLSRLILGLLKQATIPFHGEPAIGVQVMGLLETRNLDFRNVVMLSVNEGQLPKSDKRASLIPYTLRAAYGMTTIEREVSLYAYYYYRLLQRADHITLLYNSSTEGGNKGEMSRFMLQTLIEKNTLFGQGQDIQLRAFSSQLSTYTPQPISVKKDEAVMERMYQRFDTTHILSPSAINTYMKCPLCFYLSYVAGLRPEDELTDDIDRAMFGNILHHAMHHLYLPWEGKTLPSTQVRAMADDEPLILQQLNNAIAVKLFKRPELDEQGNIINYQQPLNGTQLINRHVIKRFIINQLQADAQTAETLEQQGGYWHIISLEKKYTTPYQLPSLTSHLLLGGIVDRLDLLASPQGDCIRIVDYKTSSKPHTANTIADLFDPEKCTSNYHITQTLYYCKVLSNTPPPSVSGRLVPALMYCAKAPAANATGIVRLIPPGGTKREEIADYMEQYSQEYETLLAQKIEEIFTPYAEDAPHGTFTQCADEQHCTFCDFLLYCQRHPKNTNF